MIDYEPAGFWKAPGGETINQGYRCTVCGALVDIGGLSIHDEWHARQDRRNRLVVDALENMVAAQAALLDPSPSR